MRVKKIRIKSLKDSLDDFARVFKQVQAGKRLPTVSEPEIYFESIEAVRKIMTPQRMRLLRYIKQHKPQSIYSLAKGIGKDIKNVYQDLTYLGDIGLIALKDSGRSRRQKQPVLLYDCLSVEFVI